MTDHHLDNHSISNIIMEDIVNDIILGELKPGDKLIEAKYAEKFGVSRAPIREAFNTLAIEGIIIKIPRKESVVKGYTDEEIWDLVRIRKFLTDLALERLEKSNQISELVRDLKEIERKMEKNNSSREYVKLNQEFNMRIIREAKSDVLIAMYSRIARLLLSLSLVTLLENENNGNPYTNHNLIIQKLEKEDFVGAQKVLNDRNESFMKNIKIHLLKKKNEVQQQC
ncbi:GntR family transcriptional regulator [Niallia oryzisoli]|uniref:GntR family transcriptional regulator n=1 Tax=Niallia oryzisoli TaxID=1737571 RepID=A0ABZ2C722_9BACI